MEEVERMKKKKRDSLQTVWMFCLLACFLPPLHAADWYASPTGSPTALGTAASPWDLPFALSGSRVQPGDTLFLQGGTYRGKFRSTLRGTPSAPITVRSAAGEWAVIDGFYTTTLAAAVDATTGRLSFADASAFNEGSAILIDAEQITLLGKSGNTFGNAQRGSGGTVASAHAAGATTILGSATTTSGGANLWIGGADTIYRDFEVMNSDPARVFVPHSRLFPDHMRGEGITQNGPRTKLVNLVVHDTRDGIFSTGASVGGEIYGCVVWGGGQNSNGIGAGHGMYLQAGDAVNRKRVENCVVFSHYNTGIKGESQNANTVGLDIARCVSWNHGAPMGISTRNPAILIGANNGVADDDSVTDCVFYNHLGGGLAQIGYLGANGKLVFTGNRLFGRVSGLDVNRWTPLTVTDNLISSNMTGAVLVNWRKAAVQAGTWDRNRYEVGANWMADSARYGTLPAWRSATGYDAAGTWSATGTMLDVQVWPNKYEPGRATITVYNRGGALAATPLDLSRTGLAAGQRYEIRNCQNWPASVAAGVYNPASPIISLPLTDTTVRQPIGCPVTIASTAPEFNAFVCWPQPAPPVDPNIAVAKVPLMDWLGIWEPYAMSHPAFGAYYAEVIDAIKGLP
jgi:hypothetical protein